MSTPRVLLLVTLGGTLAFAQTGAELAAQAEAAAKPNTPAARHEAIALYEKAIPLLRGDPGELDAWNRLGQFYNLEGEDKKSLTAFMAALALARESGNRKAEAFAQHGTGMAAAGLEQYTQAIQAYSEAIRLRHELGLKFEAAVSLNNRGSAKWSSGDSRGALEDWRDALKIREELNDRLGIVYSLLGVGNSLSRLGDPAGAIQNYMRAASLAEEEKQLSLRAHALNSAGLAYAMTGDLRAATSLYEQALAIWSKLGDRDGQLYVHTNMGLAEIARGHWPAAEEQLDTAMKLLKAGSEQRERAYILENQARVFRATGRLHEAVVRLEESLSIKVKLGDRYGEASSLALLGEAEMKLGQSDSAYVRLRGSLARRREIGDREGEAESLRLLAAWMRGRGDLAGARKQLEQAITVFESVRERVPAADTRISYLASRRQAYEELVDVLAELKEPQKAFETAERARGRVLAELLAEGGVAVREGIRPDLLAREEALRQELNAATEAVTTKGANSRIDDVLRRFSELDGEIRRSSPRYASLRFPGPMSLEEIRLNLLDADSQLFAYSLGTTRSYLWIVSRGAFEQHVLPSRSEIAKSVQKLLASVEAPGNLPAGETLEQRKARLTEAALALHNEADHLSRCLVPPGMKLSKGTRVLIAADGALHRLPFSVLATFAGAASITMIPSANVLEQIRSRTESEWPMTAAIIADPHGADSASPLPYSTAEAAAVAQHVPAGLRRQFTGPDATAERLASAGLEQFRILHFATHAVMDPTRPALSEIVLSSGSRLRSMDVYNLNLRADLVVLSACRSAAGADAPAEGLLSLTRGFLYAGARRVLATLWDVDDEASAKLMERFYAGFLGRGRPAPEALREAQRSLAGEVRYANPYYWAAYVLEGDWR